MLQRYKRPEDVMDPGLRDKLDQAKNKSGKLPSFITGPI